jgi:penicillin-binding protein 1A
MPEPSDPSFRPLRADQRLVGTQPRRDPAPPPPPEIGQPKRRRSFARVAGGTMVRGVYRLAVLGVIAALMLGGGLFFYFSNGLPSINGLKHYQPPLMTRVYASDFQLIGELGTQRRIYVPYSRIPKRVRDAFISAEDRSFWTEPGIDPLAIMRAGVVDVTRLGSHERPLGASTITMQVVKNMLLHNRINFVRKIQEAILAVRVNRALTKKQVLTLYLNEIYLGQNSWGVAAAAQDYFAKPLSQLTVAEAAMLGGLPKAPTNYNPFLHPDRALRRRNWVINRMLADGKITQDEARIALASPLLPHAAATPRIVPGSGYFAGAVQAQLIQLFGKKTTFEGGLIVRTSLDPRLQTAAMDAIRNRLDSYDREFNFYHGPVATLPANALSTKWPNLLAQQKAPPGMRRRWRLGVVLTETAQAAKVGWLAETGAGAESGLVTRTAPLTLAAIQWGRPMIHGYPGPKLRRMAQMLHPGDVVMVQSGDKKAGLKLEQIPAIEGSMLSMDPQTGRVLAMVGGWSDALSPYNRATQAMRQPGSSVKPFDYLTAMQSGMQPDATILDAPFVQRLADGQVYRPGNYEMSFMGPVPVFYALEQSLNLATLHLVRQVGLANIAANFKKFGVVHHMPLIYPAAIGALDTTLWRMVRGYAAIDEYGRQVTPSLIDSVTAPDGRILYQAPDQTCENCTNGAPDAPPVLKPNGDALAGPNSAYQVIMMMRNVVEHGTGTPAVAGIKRPIAGKTGTTNNFNDAWFIGFVPQMVTGCWMGFDKPRDLGKNQTGGNVCGPAWNQYMKVALKGQPVIDFPTPPGMTLASVNFGSQTVQEAFKPGQAPGLQSHLGFTENMAASQADSTQGGAGQLNAVADQTGGAAPNPGPAAFGTPNQPGAAGQPPSPQPANLDKSLGGLY